ncbi:unnamed protein product [Clonostachys rosea f. rosea IK726]|uniref:Uncharacterized protein n=1 Tax=Clonostachys rosea f. rosea IK726 TaxID=1349383 RepID=A0ACA9U212_BIOOC|nr:unnamed protein product [Clonostachys rosea f. rosea IK726]
MTILNTIQTLISSTPVHLVCFFALLGTEIHQSLITAKKYFHALRKDQSLTLHKGVSPILLRAQSILLILVAVTVPPHGLISLIEHKSSWIPLLVGSYATALNVFLFHPRASRALSDLQLQSIASTSGKASETEPLNPNVAALEKSFRRNRAATVHLNMVTVIATIWYGCGLAKSFNA